MTIKRQRIYDFSISAIGLGLLVILTLLKTSYNDLSMPLFLIFVSGAILLQWIDLRIGEFTLTFDTSVVIASNFILGLVPTLWILYLIFFGYRIIVNKTRMKTALINTGIMIVIYTMTYFSFEYLGYGLSKTLSINNVILIAIFSIEIFVLNWVFLILHFKVSNSKLPDSWIESMKWDFYGNLIIIPLSILMIEGYQMYQYTGLMLLLSLIVFANLLFKLMRNLVFLNNELRVVHKASVSISSELELDDATSNIVDGINELVKCDYCSILKFDSEKQCVKTMKSKAFRDIGIVDEDVEGYISTKLDTLIEQKSSFIENKSKIGKIELNVSQISDKIKSVIYEPLIAKDEIIGCIVIFSHQYKKFVKEHLSVMDILANQAAIAIENARMYKETKNRAIKDSLTGLYNQSYFFDRLDSLTGECVFCNRHTCVNCKTTSLIIFDIDHFKKVNDNYGHQTGDKILREVTQIIRQNVRNSDIVSRYGGEEFTVILPKTDESVSYKIADRIREIIESTPFYTVENKQISITISGGVSEFPKQADSGSSLLAYADRAMYIGSKRQGRNKISKYVS